MYSYNANKNRDYKFSGTMVAPDFSPRAVLNSYNILFKTLYTFCNGYLHFLLVSAWPSFRCCSTIQYFPQSKDRQVTIDELLTLNFPQVGIYLYFGLFVCMCYTVKMSCIVALSQCMLGWAPALPATLHRMSLDSGWKMFRMRQFYLLKYEL